MFWDRVAWVYDVFADLINGKVHRELSVRVAELVQDSDEVLECACGTGMLTVHLAPRCRRIVATDLSEKMLKKAKKKCAAYGHVTLEKTDIMNLPYEDDSFDIVLAANVVHLLPEPECSIAEMKRVCRDGGRLIIPTYVGASEKRKKLNAFSRLVGKMGAGFQRQFTRDTYRSFFDEMGFEHVEYFVVEGKLPCAVAIIRNRKDADCRDTA